jgi:hypothetical protein
VEARGAPRSVHGCKAERFYRCAPDAPDFYSLRRYARQSLDRSPLRLACGDPPSLARRGFLGENSSRSHPIQHSYVYFYFFAYFFVNFLPILISSCHSRRRFSKISHSITNFQFCKNHRIFAIQKFLKFGLKCAF